MNLTNSQYDQLMAQYSARQHRAIRELDKRREEVYQAIPELHEWEEKARSLSLSYVRNASGPDATTPQDFAGQMASYKREYARLLSEHGFAEDYLEPVYECPDCKDTGYINGEKCHCLKKAAIRLFYRQSNLERVVNEESFDTFDLSLYPEDMTDRVTGMNARQIMQDVLTATKEFADFFDEEYENLLLYGDTGVGKTFLTHCIAGQLLAEGHSVLYLDAIGFFEQLEARQFDREMNYSEKSSMLSHLLDCDLLIIDDLGTELANGFTTSQLYHVIEGRDQRRRATIITTNLSLQDLNAMYTERVFSRIIKNYRKLRLIGDDIRLKKL